MAEITFKGEPVHTSSTLPEVGSKAPDFSLTKRDLQDVRLDDYSGKRLVLNIFPSLDTPVCATSVRKFNSEAEKLNNTVVLCISKDLPFAHDRFCVAEGLDNVVSLSEFRDHDFSKKYGVDIIDSPLAGLMARSVVVLNENHDVVYTELVSEIAEEPNYNEALKALS